jgi:hypothetical protein
MNKQTVSAGNSVEDLLRPRYKVIADYPGSQYRIGNVVIYNPNRDVSVESFESWLSRFPVVFRRLEWWEDREENEMPEYVKLIEDNYPAIEIGTVIKVAEWCNEGGFRLKEGEYEPIQFLSDGWQIVSEAEYLTYQNKSK